MDKIKLFCIPFAGGSASSYNGWKKYFSESIEVIPVELAGRGVRFNDPFYKCFDDLLWDLYDLIQSKLENSCYALYGHSMGSLAVFELCHLFKEKGRPEPINIFLSGRVPPHIDWDFRLKENMTDDELQEQLTKSGGTPSELFKYKALFQIYARTLRADLSILCGYKYIEKPNNLSTNITIFNGDDDLPEYLVKEWKKHTCKDFDLYSFAGGHFFINENVKSITDIINEKLTVSTSTEDWEVCANEG